MSARASPRSSSRSSARPHFGDRRKLDLIRSRIAWRAPCIRSGGGSAMKKLACLTVALATLVSTSMALAEEPKEPKEPVPAPDQPTNQPAPKQPSQDEPTHTWSTPPKTDAPASDTTPTDTTTSEAA